ncbi:hypothetical protein K8O68_00195 [Salipaludibacillus sp. CUR1]|uniref:Uncharacterized protein n=1 Tax=Salipaludibacillus aurantiacus TaxID=1601833 RepID=A0A1H9SAY4_9BACI|nr:MULTISPECIES: hypothetical protein [Salipaludibacillus]MCE7790837.1 hypothetical protein [Salipaludibacillus sp. CUR1]SER82164.1 hypothetical protein SAMN05518684_104127 [Salipaludibacillus aurantiacus]
MGKKEKKHSRQFKENENHGEHRRGRLSQVKNVSEHKGDAEDAYVNPERE